MVDRKAEAEKLLDALFYVEGAYTVSSDGVVDVKGNVSYTGDYLSQLPASLPVEFGTVTGDFWATDKSLTNWKNFPETVTSLLVINDNKIRDWAGCPKKVGSLIISHNPLTTLVGMPTVTHSLDLKSCRLKNLQGIDYINSWITVQDNPLESFDGFLGCEGYISFTWSPQLPVLRTLLAKGGVRVYDPEYFGGDPELPPLATMVEILNRYAGQGRRGAFPAKKELIEAGFEGNARW
jgi:hypothetical protein